MEGIAAAFEGINGAGKSRVIDELRCQLERRPKNKVLAAKIGGLGQGRRMDCLRQILTDRERKLHAGQLIDKELSGYHRDTIFRLAYKHQIGAFLSSNLTGVTHVLLDRTPLMSWAYTAAMFPESPHIGEVREDAITFTAKLQLQWVFVLEVRPATVYGRILARHAKAHPAQLTVERLSKTLRAPDGVVREAREIAVSLLGDPCCTAKPFTPWDYMSYGDITRQSSAYSAVVEEAAQLLGFKWLRLDGEKEVGSIAAEVKATIGEAR